MPCFSFLDEEVLLKTNVPVTKHSITCIGGTFDRLHPGHKLLITKAVLHTTEKLVVGITNDGPLLAKKSYLSELQRLETREAKLRQFLSIFCPFLEIQIIPIDDIFGPTITMSELDALVVSSETHSGAITINQERKSRGMKPLFVYEIPRGNSPDEALTISSSFLRQRSFESKKKE
eukprot:TRINITY_DN1112_c0_g1_i3.p1 TRINITY_DN1112_c0_g1~~TRINITY_DN1112_c0_g1_i3.p1  ORF type:complete len:176 (+),score=27.12 TRINITY_DN1112_c0_g1_i3:422-949(+)